MGSMEDVTTNTVHLVAREAAVEPSKCIDDVDTEQPVVHKQEADTLSTRTSANYAAVVEMILAKFYAEAEKNAALTARSSWAQSRDIRRHRDNLYAFGETQWIFSSARSGACRMRSRNRTRKDHAR